MIYFITDGTYTKVGYSSDIQKRLSTLQVGNARELRINHSCEGSRYREDFIQQRLKDKRVRGEWYDITDEDIKDVLEKTPEPKCWVDDKNNLQCHDQYIHIMYSTATEYLQEEVLWSPFLEHFYGDCENWKQS